MFAKKNSYNQTAPASLQNKYQAATSALNTTNIIPGRGNTNTILTPEEEASLAKERDLKFKQWLQNKAIKERAFEYLNKIDSSRATNDESLVEVGIAVAAIERMLGVEDAPKKSTIRGADMHGIGTGEDEYNNENTGKSKV